LTYSTKYPITQYPKYRSTESLDFQCGQANRTDRHDEANSRFSQLCCGRTEILFVTDSGVVMFMGIRAQL